MWDCQVEASRLLYQAPAASSPADPQLLVQNAHVSLCGDNNPSYYTLGGFTDFLLEQATVVKPEHWGYGKDAVYYVNGYYLYDGMGYCNIAVEIRPEVEGDVNGDGDVGIGDIVAIANIMAGIK